MREIKFRIWDDILKVLYTPEKEGKIKDLWVLPEMKGGVLKVKPEIKVMQFIGLEDKNGADIYEGDILRDDGLIMTVEMINGAFCRCNDRGNWVFITTKRITVIGNIYENPELLNT